MTKYAESTFRHTLILLRPRQTCTAVYLWQLLCFLGVAAIAQQEVCCPLLRLRALSPRPLSADVLQASSRKLSDHAGITVVQLWITDITLIVARDSALSPYARPVISQTQRHCNTVWHPDASRGDRQAGFSQQCFADLVSSVWIGWPVGTSWCLKPDCSD